LNGIRINYYDISDSAIICVYELNDIQLSDANELLQTTYYMIPFTKIVRGLPATIPFVGPEAIERDAGHMFKLRLGANESAFGVSPLAVQAMREAISRTSWYGDPEGFDLRAALADHVGVNMDEIVLGAGIDELLGVLVRMLIEPGATVVTSLGAYPTFNYHVVGHGGQLLTVPYKDDKEDLPGLLNAVHAHSVPLVYLANPDNPMGTWHDALTVQQFIDALPKSTVLVLDEAYVEFAPDGTAPKVDTDDKRVVRMRTFSKAHGMAGARIGYAIANWEMIEGFSKIRNHFGVNRIAQAGALASLQDGAFAKSVVEEVARGREEYATLAQDLGLSTVDSATNFVAIDMGGDGDKSRATLRALQQQGVFVRMPSVALLDRCIRVTVGQSEERSQFTDVFTEVVNLNR